MKAAAKAGIALLTAVGAFAATTACSSGMVTQTSRQVAAVPGPNADPTFGERGRVALRNVMIAYNGPEGYPAGGNAPLVVRVFNTGMTKVTLVSATTDAAARIEKVTDNPAPPVEEPSPSASASASASPSASASASAEATPPPPPAAGDLTDEIAPSAFALLVPGTGAYLQLADLRTALTPGSSIKVTFQFRSDSGTHAVTMVVPFGTPDTAIPRASADVTKGAE